MLPNRSMVNRPRFTTQIVKDEPDYLEVKIFGIDYATIKLLRDTMLSGIPTLAFDTVEIERNTSNLTDDLLSNRMSQLPIIAPLDIHELRDYRPDASCTCPGVCPNCSVIFRLNHHNTPVMSSDFISDTPGVSIVPSIEFVPLLPGQEIVLRAVAVYGTGKQASKWNSAVSVGYQPLQRIYLDRAELRTASLLDKELLVRECPTGILHLHENGEVEIQPGSECGGYVSNNKLVTVRNSDTDFLFHVETDGRYSARTVWEAGLNILGLEK